MRALLSTAAITGLVAIGMARGVAAQEAPERPEFVKGFASLKARVGDAMGEPIEQEHVDADGHTYQLTTTGLAYWSPELAPAFTDGWHRWALTAAGGVVAWDGEQIAPPRAAAPAGSQGTGPATTAQVECIIRKESGGRDVANRQGSGATGPGQYVPATWRRSTAEMGAPQLSIHNIDDVRRVMAHDLALGRRSQWSVGGC